jgi:hypothetical protein
MGTPSAYSAAEAYVFNRWLVASRIVGSTGPIDGLRECLYGGMAGVEALSDDSALAFLRHVFAEVDGTGELAWRFLRVLRPPSWADSRHPRVVRPVFSALFPRGLVERGAVAVVAFRLNKFSVAERVALQSEAVLLQEYVRIIRAGLARAESETIVVPFALACRGVVIDSSSGLGVNVHD